MLSKLRFFLILCLSVPIQPAEALKTDISDTQAHSPFWVSMIADIGDNYFMALAVNAPATEGDPMARWVHLPGGCARPNLRIDFKIERIAPSSGDRNWTGKVRVDENKIIAAEGVLTTRLDSKDATMLLDNFEGGFYPLYDQMRDGNVMRIQVANIYEAVDPWTLAFPLAGFKEADARAMRLCVNLSSDEVKQPRPRKDADFFR